MPCGGDPLIEIANP